MTESLNSPNKRNAACRHSGPLANGNGNAGREPALFSSLPSANFLSSAPSGTLSPSRPLDPNGYCQPQESSTPGYFDVLANSINIMQDYITRTRLAGEPPHVMLVPRLRDIGLMEFDRAVRRSPRVETALSKHCRCCAVIYNTKLSSERAPFQFESSHRSAGWHAALEEAKTSRLPFVFLQHRYPADADPHRRGAQTHNPGQHPAADLTLGCFVEPVGSDFNRLRPL